MKNFNKIICTLLALVIAFAQLPLTALAYNVNIPAFTAVKKDVISQDGKWKYDIALDRNEEERVWLRELLETAEAGKDFVFPGTVDGMRVQGVDISSSANFSKVKKNSKIIFEENIEIVSGGFLIVLQNVTIELPSTLLMIDSDMFYLSKNLSINFPDGIRAIGNNAFKSCTFSSTDIVFPESLEHIGKDAFSGTNLTSVKIGSKTNFSDAKFSQTAGVYYTGSVTYPYAPFADCSSLTRLEIDENNQYFKTEDGIIYSADEKELVFMNENPADYEIPDSVEYVCSGVFTNKTFESVYIPSSIKVFGSISFSGSTIKKVIFSKDCTFDYISDTFKNSKIDEITIPKSVTNIHTEAFYKCKIKKLSFEEGSELRELGMRAFADNEIETLDLTNCALLTTAYQYAFCGNENLISVDMTGVPMEELSQSMFAGCYSLKEFKISKYSRIISTSAFAGDKELENIDLSKIAKYESTSFDRCEKINVNAYFVSSGTTEDGYVYNEFKNHISLVDYNGESTDLNIPDNINGKPVTDIVWKGNRILHKDWTDYHISSLKLPSNLEFIASRAFEFKRVSRTELPKTLSFIGESAFSDARFTSYELNDGLEYVLSGGLPGTLEDLEIPDSVICYLGGICANPDGVTTFGKNVRTIKAKLRSDLEDDKTLKIRISPENPYFCFENGVLYNGDKTEIYRYYRGYNVDEITNDYQIPETVKKIDDNAFQDCNILSSLTIPSSVEYIGNYAFDSSTLNGALTIPQNVKYIGTDAFRKTGLTSAHFADGFKTERLYCTFFACKSLQTVTFGDVDIKALVETYVDSGIKNVEIPDSVEKLSSPYRMTDLSSVTELQLPKNLKYIGGAFEGTKISITELTLPEGLKSVGPYAFAQCKKLKSIDFSNVDFLERAAFLGCDALESVDLTGITYIKEEYCGTFSDCPNLKKITFNREDRANDIEAFENQGNDGVETVIIGNGIKNVKSKAFADCSNLETAVISDSVENIADDAFENCRKLTIVCTKNSNAMLYAQKKGINYKTFKINPIPDKEYTGREIRPELNVTVGESRLAAGKDYSVSYRDNINVGTARAIAVGLGDYSIYASTVKFNIIPHQHKYSVKTVKPTYEKEGYTLHKCSCGKSYKTDKKAKLKVSAASIKKLSAGKKSVTVNFKAVKNISGYQIQYSTSKSFKTKKTVSVSNPKTVKKKIKNLKAKKKYFVRIRAYKKVSKKTYYSSWSKAKAIKTK